MTSGGSLAYRLGLPPYTMYLQGSQLLHTWASLCLLVIYIFERLDTWLNRLQVCSFQGFKNDFVGNFGLRFNTLSMRGNPHDITLAK